MPFTPPRILVCPSGFKESLDPNEAADCIEAGILRARPDAIVGKAPMVDGGEGFVKALVATTDGELRYVDVIGPVGETIESHFGFLGDRTKKTAVIEMAAAAGLRLVPQACRNPLLTTTFGVGQLIKAALDDGAEHILIGCGDSGTCDGGVGMAQALGAHFYTRNGSRIPLASGAVPLKDLATVDMCDVDMRLRDVPIDVACNWFNLLCGPEGVARVFGPQKGATPAEVEQLDEAMCNIAAVVKTETGKDVSRAPGGGASGGLGAGLRLIGAHLHPRFEIISQFLNIDDLMAECDIVFTAEGAIDSQTPRGKVPAEVALRAKKHNVPVVALAGTVGEGAKDNYDAGIHAFASIMRRPTGLETAIREAQTWLTDAAENTMRMIMIGYGL